MADFVPHPIVIREIPGVAVIEQTGAQARVNGTPAFVVEAATILGNPQHYLRRVLWDAMGRLESGEVAAVVLAPVQGKSAQILITAEQYAKGAPERARYEAWLAGVSAARAERQAAERAYDLANNEGGEGYNPHRTGTERTYARAPRRDRDYPEGA